MAYGTVGRTCKTVGTTKRTLRGMKVGLFRPISLWPYPEPRLRESPRASAGILVAEMSAGQMLRGRAAGGEGRCPVAFYGRMGGVMPLPDEILDALHHMVQGRG